MAKNKNGKNKVIKTLLAAGAATNAFPIDSSAATSVTQANVEIENISNSINNLERNKEKMLKVDENEAKKSINIPGFVMAELTDRKVAEEKGIIASSKFNEVLGAFQEMISLVNQAKSVTKECENSWMKPDGGFLGLFKNHHEEENITIQKTGYENSMTYIENLGRKQKGLVDTLTVLPNSLTFISRANPCFRTIKNTIVPMQELDQILSNIINNKSSNISKTEAITKKRKQASRWLELNSDLNKGLTRVNDILTECNKDLNKNLAQVVDDCDNLGAIYSQALQNSVQAKQKDLDDKWKQELSDLKAEKQRIIEELARINNLKAKEEKPVIRPEDTKTKEQIAAEIKAEQERVNQEYQETRHKLIRDLNDKLDAVKKTYSMDLESAPSASTQDLEAAPPANSMDDVTTESLKEIQPLLDELEQLTLEKITEIESISDYSNENANALKDLLMFKQTQANKISDIHRQFARNKAKFKTFKKRMDLKKRELIEKTKQCDYKIEEFLFNVKASLGAPTHDELMNRQGLTIKEIRDQISAARSNIEKMVITLENPNLEQQLKTIDEHDIVRLNERIGERVKSMTSSAIAINTQVLLKQVQDMKDKVEKNIREMDAYKPDTLPDGFTDIAEGLWNAHEDSNKIMRNILNETVKALKQSKQETLTENINVNAVSKADGFSKEYFALNGEIKDKFMAMINTYKSRKAQMDAWDLVFKNNNVAQTAINRLNVLRSERGLPAPVPGEISATERELVKENTEAVLRGSSVIAKPIIDGLLSDKGHPIHAIIVSGKTGSGKTETVKTVAAQLNLEINTITKNDIDRGGIQLANQILERAKNGDPILILWDEAVSGVIADTKNPLSGNISDTVNEHLNFIDRLREQPDGRIVYVMTTNAREDYMHPPIKGRCCTPVINLDASGKSAMEAINGILDAIPTADWIETAQERSKKVQDAYSLKMRTNSSSILGLRGLKQAVINAQNKAFKRQLKAWESRRGANVDLTTVATQANDNGSAPTAKDLSPAPVVNKDFPFDDVRERVILYSKREEKPCLQLTYVTADEIIQEMNKQ